jgi:hypothetical protein
VCYVTLRGYLLGPSFSRGLAVAAYLLNVPTAAVVWPSSSRSSRSVRGQRPPLVGQVHRRDYDALTLDRTVLTELKTTMMGERRERSRRLACRRPAIRGLSPRRTSIGSPRFPSENRLRPTTPEV